MNLVIDIGNTAVKVYLFKNNVIIKREVLSENALIQYLKLIYLPFFKGTLAQLVEQRTENPCVPGSIPGGTTKNPQLTLRIFLYFNNP